MITHFTSDLHFGHKNIIKYTNRPFNSVEEMNESLIQTFNDKVDKDDTVYCLGDFAFMHANDLRDILSRLNGNIHLIYGNHDKVIRSNVDIQKQFASVGEYKEVTIDKQHIVMCHYPMVIWNRKHHNSWMLHGHCHGTLTYPFTGKIFDVGYDATKQITMTFEELKPIMDKFKNESIDHH
jgi:calcineurin-like phosphoesterase family protein